MPQHHRPIGIVQLVFISLLVWMLIDCGNSEVQRHGLFEWKPCPESCTLEMLSRKGHTDKSDGARAFYLILIHNERTQNDAIHLFRAIRDPRNIIFIHYDTAAEHLMKQTSSKNVLLQEIETCPCGAIIRLESVYTVEWSKWSMNLPTLYGMQVAVEEYQDQWDVFINLSGDTLPIYSQDTMAKMLYQLSDYNFVASRSCETDLLPTSVNYFPSFWHKRRHYTNDEKESDPTFFYSNGSETKNMTVTVHFGSQWVILQHSFCHWLIHELRDPQSWPSQLQNHLRESGKLMTDETFIPSVLMHAEDFVDTLPYYPLTLHNGTIANNIYHVRYERMDEHYPSPFGVFPQDQHYQVPDTLLHVLDQPRIWGPYFLGVYDLGDIRRSGALFARKVSALIDPNMVRLLPVKLRENIPDIRWSRNEMSFTPKRDWSIEMAAWGKYMGHHNTAETTYDEEEL